MKNAIAWNAYQQAIFDWATDQEGNAVVGAVAGSGKTTVIEEMIRRISGASSVGSAGFSMGPEILYCVFNRHNRDSAEVKFGNMATVKTIHQLGWRMIADDLNARRLNMSDYKYWDCFDELLKRRGFVDKKAILSAKKIYADLWKMARLTMQDLDDRDGLDLMCDKYGILYEEWMLDDLPEILAFGINSMRTERKIDMDDMIFMPAHLGLKCAQYDWLLVDEAQDLSNCQRTVVLMHLRDGGRFTAVGDERQSIYGFAGSNPDSYRQIQISTNGKELPLSVCYRCPTSHVALAKEIAPAIEAAPNAAEGIVRYAKEEMIVKEVMKGDLILCRKTAPLIKNCIKLIKQRIPANVRGRNIGAGLAAIVDKITDKQQFIPSTFEKEFMQALDSYSDKEVAKLIAREASEDVIEGFMDKIDCITIVVEEFECKSGEAILGELDNLFSDAPGMIYFSTIHRAKGLENDRVLILKPDKMALRWKGMTAEQALQEDNAKYVGLTRAKKELVFLEDEEA